MKLFSCVYFALYLSLLAGAKAGEYDHSKLKNMDVEQAQELFLGLRLDYLAVPDEEKRPDLYREAQYWMSQNEKLRQHCEAFFKETPHTVPTATKRALMISLLGRLTAEWSVRLLLEEVMIDRKGQDTIGAEPPIEEWDDRRWSVEAHHGFRDFVRNDELAARKVFQMKLKSIPKTRWDDIEKGKMEELQVWYKKNKHRLDAVVQETWGDKAILDKDMLGYLPVGKSGSKVRRPQRLASKSENGDLQTKRKQDLADSSTGQPIYRMLLILALGAVSLLLVLYIYIKQKHKRSS